MSTQVQINRRGADAWELTRLTKIALPGEEAAWEYELIGRVVAERGAFWVDFPHWQDTGHAWHRQAGTGYATKKAAYRAVTERQQRAS